MILPFPERRDPTRQAKIAIDRKESRLLTLAGARGAIIPDRMSNRKGISMGSKHGLIREVIPAQPGFVVLYSEVDVDDVPATFDESHFIRTNIIAWCVDVWVHPEDDSRVMSVTSPLTIEGNVEGHFAIIDPTGNITRPFYQSYPCVQDAMADIWRDMLRHHERVSRLPFLAEPKAKAA